MSIECSKHKHKVIKTQLFSIITVNKKVKKFIEHNTNDHSITCQLVAYLDLGMCSFMTDTVGALPVLVWGSAVV